MAAETLYFLRKTASVGAGRFGNVKAVFAQPTQRFVISSCFYRFCHFPVLPIFFVEL